MADVSSPPLSALPVDSIAQKWSVGVRFHLLLLGGAIAVGVALQFFGPAWAQRIFEQVRLTSLLGLGVLVVALLASMLAHELGHLGAALFLNYKVLGMALGPVRLEWGEGKLSVHVVMSQWSRCSISAVPREIQNCWRVRMLLVVAAGPIISLLFLLFALAAQPGLFWSSCAEVNFFLVLLGLVPNGRQAKARNDAALFRTIWLFDEDARDMRTCHKALELGMRGVRPSEYPEARLDELAGYHARPYTRYMAARRLCEWAIDSRQLTLAESWDREAVAASGNCSERVKNQAIAESACLDVVFRNDYRSAVRKFVEVNFETLTPKSLAARAEAARVIACGAPHLATPHILRARGYGKPADGYAAYEGALLDALEQKTGRLLAGKH